MRRRVPWVQQMAVTDCGAACLAMVLAYHGKQVPLDELRSMTSTSRDGVDALAVTRAAQQYGLRARGVAADVDELGRLPPATILHWEFTHFVVFERLTSTGVQVVDPALGRRRLSMEAFGRLYTGVAITFEPTEHFQPSTLHTRGTWRYLRPLLGQSRRLTRVLVGSILLRLLALALPLVTGLLVSEIVPRGDRHLLLVTGVAMAAVVGYFFLATLVRSHLLLQLRTRLDVSLTTTFVQHLVDLPYAFFLGRSAGDLMMRLQSNTVVREFLTTATISALIDGGLGSLYLVLLFLLSPPLAALVLGLGLLQVLVLVLARRRNQHLMSETLEVQAKSQSYTFELLAGIETLKAAGAERRAAAHWERLFIDQVNVALRRGRLDASLDAVTGTIQLGSPLAILVYGGSQVVNGDLSLGTMLAAAALAAGFLEPLATMISAGLKLQLLRSYMDRINDVLDAAREQEGQTVATAPRLTGRLRADGVSFSYGPLAPPVVKDVSLQVEAGQLVGIVGRSGSGKSTLASLLLGLFTPTSGRVLFDGHDLAELDLRSLRRQIGIVTQRPYLFGGTIRQNIALSDPEMPAETVIDAARSACIHDEIVAMPMGYDTPLIDGGVSLSGGQQQRIALARALAHRPTVLLLDEATSDLDSVNERMAQRNISALGCTRIVIAHRLSTVADADLILVMEDGRIVQRGTHDELMALPGPYRDQVVAQFGSVSSDAPPSRAFELGTHDAVARRQGRDARLGGQQLVRGDAAGDPGPAREPPAGRRPVVTEQLARGELVPEGLWRIVEPLLQPRSGQARGGRSRSADERAVFSAVVYVLSTGSAWAHLPAALGVSPATATRRFVAWTEGGLWRRLHRAVLAELPEPAAIRWSETLLEAARRRVRQGRGSVASAGAAANKRREAAASEPRSGVPARVDHGGETGPPDPRADPAGGRPGSASGRERAEAEASGDRVSTRGNVAQLRPLSNRQTVGSDPLLDPEPPTPGASPAPARRRPRPRRIGSPNG